jgi:predicted DNA-binding transcriptional regulator AlpA
MSSLQPLIERMDAMADAVQIMARMMGTRLTHGQMCERLGVCSSTLTTRVKNGTVPRPTDGKWLLSEVLEWETRR